jgi:MoaA/NifB/PqqE/SkfB family radical SAM enzyme
MGWLHELDAEGCLGVGFGGGEPTLHPDFADICRETCLTTDLAVTFTTHGHRITPELAKRLVGNVHFIRVSVDGVGAVYEQLRGRSFRALTAAVSRVAEISNFGINIVINNQTLPTLDDLAEFAARFGASEILLLPEVPVGMRRGIDEESLDRLRAWIQSYAGGVRLAVSEAQAPHDIPTAQPFSRAEPPLTAHAHIAADGVLKHHSFEANGVQIGPAGVMSAIERLRTEAERNE